MNRTTAAAAVAVAQVACSQAFGASALERSLDRLDPAERVRQLCDSKGLETVQRDARLRGANAMKSSIFAPASVRGAMLTATGGAVRLRGRWFRLSFTCTLTADQKTATAFTYQLGAEIPADHWERYGLW